MHRIWIVLALTIALAGASPVAGAEGGADRSDEEKAILALVDAFMDGLHRRDPEVWKTIMLAGTNGITPLVDDHGKEFVRLRTMEERLDGLIEPGPTYDERYWDPTVLIRERIAVVWTPYDFWIDGEFSHCGVEVFDFVRVDGEWKLTNMMWTVEREDCEPSPLGSLKKQAGGP